MLLQAVSPTASSVPACAQTAQALVEEAGWMIREPVEVSSGALRTYRKKLQVAVAAVVVGFVVVILVAASVV